MWDWPPRQIKQQSQQQLCCLVVFRGTFKALTGRAHKKTFKETQSNTKFKAEVKMWFKID